MNTETTSTVIVLLCVCVFSFYAKCLPHSDAEQTAKTVAEAGFTDVKVERGVILTCGEDWYGTQFNALNPAGKRVTGVVCCGLLFKGCTIRW